MKRIISLLIPVVITALTTIAINSFLDKEIEMLTKQKEISLMGKKFSDVVKDKSAVDKKLLSDQENLFLLGSSEMGINVPQNALNIFPFKGAEYSTSCFGRAYSQDLQQANYLGAESLEENQKVALIVSIQWFEEQDSISPYNFAVNFSDIQFYKFLENPKISVENKKYYAERVYKLLTKAKKYPSEAFYAKLYIGTSKFNEFQKAIFLPYYKTKEYLLEVKDKALLYKEIKELPDKNSEQVLKDINWEDEYEKIQKESTNTVSTNKFYINDNYYNSELKNMISQLEGQSKSENPVSSKEMDDFKFFLSICRDLDIKPYIVMMPVNGWYYDYVGLTKDKRYSFYDTIKQLANDNNLEALDLRGYEYKKDFLIDAKHLGKEGWLKVSEEIYKHFKKT